VCHHPPIFAPVNSGQFLQGRCVSLLHFYNCDLQALLHSLSAIFQCAHYAEESKSLILLCLPRWRLQHCAMKRNAWRSKASAQPCSTRSGASPFPFSQTQPGNYTPALGFYLPHSLFSPFVPPLPLCNFMIKAALIFMGDILCGHSVLNNDYVSMDHKCAGFSLRKRTHSHGEGRLRC
jgi:hypothetical protein